MFYNDDQHYLTQLHVAGQARADQVWRAAANDNPAADPATLAATIASVQQATASDYTRTLYAHMSPTLDANGKPILIGPNKVQLVVKPGDKVKAGQLIGFVGDTGNATDPKSGARHPQLHYEVRYGLGSRQSGRVVINPSYFLLIDN